MGATNQNAEIIDRLSRIEQLLAEQSLKPMSLIEAASYLGIKTSTLYKLTATNQIACYRPGGKKIYFTKADCDAYLLRNRSRTVDEMLRERGVS